MSRRDPGNNYSKGFSRSAEKGRDDRYRDSKDESRERGRRDRDRSRSPPAAKRERGRARRAGSGHSSSSSSFSASSSPSPSPSRSRSRDSSSGSSSASRSPRSRSPPRSRREVPVSRKRKDQADTNVKEMSISPQRDDSDKSSEGVPSPPPAPRITKISIGFNKPISKPKPIMMPVGTSSKAPAKPPLKVASVFNDGSDDEPEEMPAEARMRMRNIGRETPTSAGPNSFGKTKHGFCDPKGIIQKNLKDASDNTDLPSNTSKYPKNMYKLQ